ncbi:hypothetical protein DFA_10211 [Cavenderia fasciculata]|uniref:Uncharacterized protein n=1 Tax=Cavenderia fasciculata TaxID=261658 RepID=F4Q9K8_CACFS|nr:uncharacterized protein DFA_10211 [Cavenderia fasciculata]EGG15377.1 hypothetical protein DFA_10211 [Cavenderia fasciculata]|eukprot:XP_004354119.1 hypothetical protein DFA_10211 [Cavenderia fasciculata]
MNRVVYLLFNSIVLIAISFIVNHNNGPMLNAVNAISLDIHLSLDNNTFDLVVGYNKQIRSLAPNDQIDLGNTSLPHITLYLTDFDNNSISFIQQDLSEKANDCEILLNQIVVQGQYAMWYVENNDCLQYMSDLVVNTTYQYIVPNQPIPDWVLQLPEPLRTLKIDMIEKYGSPNVFSQFQPHITLAWDQYDNMTAVFEELSIPDHTYISPSVGVGDVGNYGTVLNNQYALYNFNGRIHFQFANDPNPPHFLNNKNNNLISNLNKIDIIDLYISYIIQKKSKYSNNTHPSTTTTSTTTATTTHSTCD